MYFILKYRLVASLFVGIFTIYSIGITKTISCHTVKRSINLSCCIIKSIDHVPIIKSQSDYLCCKIKISPTKSRVEYIQNNIDINSKIVKYSFFSIPQFVDNFKPNSIKQSIIKSYSPLSFEDIPIITSSLLI